MGRRPRSPRFRGLDSSAVARRARDDGGGTLGTARRGQPPVAEILAMEPRGTGAPASASGRDAVVVADPYQAVVGPTGRGITGDIVTYSHPDDAPLPRAKGRTTRDGTTHLPSSLDDAFVLDGPGEYEVKHVLVNGVRTFRDEKRGAERGRNVAFVTELDGVHVIHLGDIAHRVTEEKLGEIGSVDVACARRGPALTDEGRRARRAARPQDRGADAGLRRRRSLRRDPRQVLPRDGHHGERAAAAPLHHAERPSRRDDDRPARIARQGLAAGDDPPSDGDRPHQVRAGPVRDLPERRHVPDDEIGPQPRGDRSPVGQPSAAAALTVAAASASAGSRRRVTTAEAIARGGSSRARSPG